MPNLAATLRQRLEADGGTVIDRSRNAVTARMPDGTNRTLATQRRLYANGVEIDTDLDPDSGGWVAKARAALPYDIRIGDTGGRRLIPRKEVPGEFIEFGRLQHYTGSAWEDVPLGGWERVANRILWDQPTYTLEVALLPDTAKINFVLKDPVADRPIRWAVTLVGLTWNAGTLIADSDGTEVAWLRPPHWEDAAGQTGPVPWDYVAGHIRFDPDLTGAVYPVLIDPDVDLAIYAGADDGYITSASGFSAGSNVLAIGENPSFPGQYASIWLRFDWLPIPPGATITNAVVDFVNTYDGSGESPQTVIDCIAEDDHGAPTTFAEWSTDHGLHTGNPVTWDFTGGTLGATSTTSDFSDAVQAVIDRAGWATGNAIGVHIDDDGSAIDEWVNFAAFEDATYDPPLLDITWTGGITVAVTATADDGYVATPSTFQTNFDIRVGYATNTYHGWLRFDNVAIPAGSLIVAAAIRFEGYSGLGYSILSTIDLVDEDDHVAPTDYSEWSADNGNLTGNPVTWDFTSPTSGVPVFTPDISTPLQAVVSRAGWASGQAIGVQLNDDGSSNLANLSPYGTEAPVLFVTYTELPTYFRPNADVAATGWATNPTPGGSLYAQVDEETISDTDFIDADGV